MNTIVRVPFFASLQLSSSHNTLHALAVLSLVACHSALASDNYEFEPSFLRGGASAFDLAKFTRGNAVIPGTYLVDIIVNEVSVGRDNIVFRAKPGEDSAEPCITVEVLDRIGVDLLKLSNVDTKNRQNCVDLVSNITPASVSFDSSEQRLLISIPQINMRRSAQGYVDPSQWDRGVTAGMLNYNYNSFYSSTQQSGAQNYLGLSGGMNLGDWHFRSSSSFDWNGNRRTWQSRTLYAQRDIQSLSSQLTVGDSSTNGNLFDSFSLRGIQIASDERMLPDSLSGYAPVVRGQANTNAKVEIRQNGYTIYETTVAPGAFEIDDLYPSGYGGDLEVTVTEADGQIRKFSVPYAAVARMLRPGTQRYSAVLGQYHNGFNNSDKQMVGQLTYERGLSNLFTGYTGVLAAEGYFSPMIGSAMNTSIGAFGVDVTHASTKLSVDEGAAGGKSSGQSMRVSYSKTLPQTGSSVSIAAYRYSTSGYYSLSDAMAVKESSRKDDRLTSAHFDPREDSLNNRFRQKINRKTAQQQRRRSTIQLTFNQSLGSSGSIYMTGSATSYWSRPGTTTQYQVGYTGSTRHFNYSVSAMRSTNFSGSNEDQLYATLSIPLGGSTTASSSFSFNKNGTGVRSSINGTGGMNNEYGWGASATKAELGSKSVATYGDYKGSMGTLNASVGSGNGYRQAAWGAGGSIVAHPGGITFGQSVSDTFAIIEAPGAEGASITSQSGVKVDKQGFAVVPYLSPYRRNNVDIDPRDMSIDVELKSTSQELIPRAGAVLSKKFETVTGRAAIIDLEMSTGLTVPFGTEVMTDTGSSVGIVGQGGRAIVRGLNDNGTLIIKWGGSAVQQCQIAYALAPVAKGSKPTRFDHFSAPCDPTKPNVRAVIAQREY
ncbi:fimbria/pilus outer membrane usher protein [Pseudomonas sp. CCM 7893]|uniref:Fimbria/pilus outer membrane usher protein n=1 Tax=Pseudomonas spelaei TaxID=1055469 RepID=A0A6I3WDY8_9PSED|nr:fimbria/pilus outer membrane usher protein [Pseudomonas spelaei]MUF07958.1 fimbria/pilus outer membrane usher protein [Pseudomonas spelaei]